MGNTPPSPLDGDDLLLDLALHKPFGDGRGQVQDFSGNDNHGTVYGSPALSFDGVSDDATIEEALVTQFPFTVSGWFNTSAAATQCLFWCGDKDVNTEYFALVLDSGGDVNVYVYDGSVYISEHLANVNDGVNHHIAAVAYVDEASFKVDIYLDGTLAETLSHANWASTFWTDITADRTSLGQFMKSTPSSDFTGTLYDWQLYDGYQATLADVKAMRRGGTIEGATLTARWINGTRDGDVLDHSGNGKRLTVTGASWDFGANGSRSGRTGRDVLDFVAANNDYASIEEAVVTAFPFTVSGWMEHDSGAAIFWLGDKDSATRSITTYFGSSTDIRALVNVDDYSPESFTSLPSVAEGTHHLAFTFYVDVAAVKIGVYLNGTFVTTLTHANWDVDWFSNVAADRLGFSRFLDSTPGGDHDGRMWDWRVHSAKLSAADIKALYLGQSIDTDPLAYWKMAGDGTDEMGSYDLTVTGPDTVHGPYEMNRSSLYGGEMFFDGTSSYVDAGSSSELDDLEEFTFVIWGTFPPSSGAIEYFFDKGTTSIRFIRTLSGRLYGEVDYDGTDAASTGSDPEGVVPINQLTMLCMRYSVTGDRKIDLFIDGVEVGAYSSQVASVGNREDDSAGNMHVGAITGGSSPCVGTVIRPKIYDRPLTDAEILTLYQEGTA